jgi:hypothetical protein
MIRLAAILICLAAPGVFAGSAESFAAANRDFESGDHAKAAAAYEKILATEGPRASVYYNLGNSYQKLGQYGPAILAYERARLITPRDPDLKANLALARKAAAAFEEPRIHPRLDAALLFLSRNEWSWLVAGASLVFGGSILAGCVFRPSSRNVRRAWIAAAAVALFAVITGSTALHLRRDEARRGVILTDSADVRLSPFASAESLGTPGPGRTVYLRERQGDFHYIEVPSSNLKGWLSSRDVAPVMPDDPASAGIPAANNPSPSGTGG